MIRRILYILLCVAPLTTAAQAMETEAKQAFMMDFDTGSVLLSKKATELMHPSSMSKLMTAYIAFSKLKDGQIKLTDEFPVSEKAWSKQGSKTFVRLNETISVEDLLKGIIVQSGNDACIVLAEGISGSEERFAEEMTRVAKEIGLEQSNFVNATGWPHDDHQMSARDLATLAKRLIQDFPEYYHYYAIREFTYSGIQQFNRNPLFGSSLGVDGLKTGHTEVAGYGITLSAKKDDRRLILVINGLPSEKARKEEGKKLLSYGFREFTNKNLLNEGQKVAEAPVWFGEADTVTLVASQDVMATVPNGSNDNARYTIKYVSPVPSPVEKGAHIADLHIDVGQPEPVVVPLLARENVAKASGLGKAKALVKHYIGG